jgi:hypothetical protein
MRLWSWAGTTLAALAALGLSSVTASATVVTFEAGLDPLFSYSSDVSVLNGATFPVPASGYGQVAAFTGSQIVAFNGFEASPSTFTWAGPGATFTLDSMVVAGAWGSQTLTVQGYNNGSLLYSTPLFVTPAPTLFSPNWSGLDQFQIYTGSDHVNFGLGFNGLQWVLDNVTVNETIPDGSPVPEPTGLFFLSIGALTLLRRLRVGSQADASLSV